MQPANTIFSEWHEGLAQTLQLDLQVSLSDCKWPVAQLGYVEKQRYAQFCVQRRREHWLRGRHALKQVLRKMQLPIDTGAIVFPHPHLSLSHSEEYALAVGTTSQVRGLGVDLELATGPRKEAAHLFMSENELASFHASDSEQQKTLLRRIWCIKEAAFKANPCNENTALFDYELHDISAWHGKVACTKDSTIILEYAVAEVTLKQQLACIVAAIFR